MSFARAFARGSRRSASWVAALLATTAGAPAFAQGQPPAPGNTSIGPESLRNFSIAPQRQVVPQPTPTPAPTLATPPAVTPAPVTPAAPIRQPGATPPATVVRPAPAIRPTPTPRAAAQPAPSATPQPAPIQPDPVATTPPPAVTPEAASPVTTPTPAPVPEAVPATSPAAPSEGVPLWLYAVGAAVLALGGLLLLRRRRNRMLALPSPEDEAETVSAQPVPQPSTPRVPRPDPVPRPWIELDLIAERATADAQESVVEFALTVRNSGGSTARNLKLQAKLICGTLSQDEEIAAFQRKKPGEHRTISLPDLPAGEEILVQGRVDSKGDDLKALRVEQKLLFIPLVVVNAFYDWNSSRTGQTSKSFLVGREKADPAERMAPFRLDLGPRVYRTVGQRPYKIERRV